MKRFLVVCVMLSALVACTKQKKESLSDIQKREGIPVRVQVMKDQQFSKELYFTSSLGGYKQTSEFSPIATEVSKVLVKVGQKVKKGQTILQFPDDKPSANYLQAKSAYDNNAKTYNRMKKVYKKGGISKQDMDNIATQYQVSKANFASASQLVKVTSPIDGVVSAMNVSLTDNISQGAFLFTVSDLSKLKAKLYASEAQIMQMKEGQKVRAEWNKVTLQGKITELSMSKDPISQSFVCFAEFDNSNMQVLSGVLADIYVRVIDLPKAKAVPFKVVQNDKEGSFVYVVEQNIAKKRYVQIKEQNQTMVRVSGLMADEQVVLVGYNMVYDGCKVKVVQ